MRPCCNIRGKYFITFKSIGGWPYFEEKIVSKPNSAAASLNIFLFDFWIARQASKKGMIWGTC